jgi:hypothetical protein
VVERREALRAARLWTDAGLCDDVVLTTPMLQPLCLRVNHLSVHSDV